MAQLGTATNVTAKPFGELPSGQASLYTLEAEGGLRVEITNFGGAIVSLSAPDREGDVADVVLGYETLAKYVSGASFFGGVIGRYGNRIAEGNFTIDGQTHCLARNNGRHHLHGGPSGFDRVLWSAEGAMVGGVPTLKLSRVSPDGEEGYPGSLRVEVTYSLATPDTLRINYFAKTSHPTPINLTNHAYFNLGGHASGTILGHELTIFADCFTPVDGTLIPTGELRPVAGGPFDFRAPRRIGERIEEDSEQLRYAGGYDHNFVLRKKADDALLLAALLTEPDSGRFLEIRTTEPGIQFYSGNFLSGADVGKDGVKYLHRTGLCLETQHFPDSPNQPAFPNTILRPGESYQSTTEYRFGVR